VIFVFLKCLLAIAVKYHHVCLQHTLLFTNTVPSLYREMFAAMNLKEISCTLILNP